MDITAPDGTVIYSGDGTALTEFSIDIDKDGKYVILVNAERAKGTVRIETKQSVATTKMPILRQCNGRLTN